MFDVHDIANGGYRRVEVLTGPSRRPRWTTEAKAWIVEETLPTFHNHHLMGIVLEWLGRLEEPLVEACTASELMPDNADPMGRFAETLFLAKRVNEAESVARNAVSMLLDSESLKRLLANIVGQRSAQSAPKPEAVAVGAPSTEAPVQQAEQTAPVREVAAANALAVDVL